jgi:hypothetical protein
MVRGEGETAFRWDCGAFRDSRYQMFFSLLFSAPASHVPGFYLF